MPPIQAGTVVLNTLMANMQTTNVIRVCLLCMAFVHADATATSTLCGKTIQGEYIVSLKSGLDPNNIFEDLIRAGDLVIEDAYVIGTFNGVFVKCSRHVANAISSMTTSINRVEENAYICGHAVNKKTPSYNIQYLTPDLWHLERISSIVPDYDNGMYKYGFDQDGRGVDIYIMDSGVRIDHKTFEGRAVHGMTIRDIEEEEGDDDLNGHGTHVAGLAAGAEYGTAKKSNIIAVKIWNKNGTGKLNGAIEGLDWIEENHQNKLRAFVNSHKEKYFVSKKAPKGIVNMSGGGGRSYALEHAIREAIKTSGLIFVAGAGNTGTDSCNVTPACMTDVITVGATDKYDKFAPFSNYGECVNILAPGVNIKSAGIINVDDASVENGTSMAAPLVSGVIARAVCSYAVMPTIDQIKRHVSNYALKDVIVYMNPFKKTPNLLLHASSGSVFTPLYSMNIAMIVIWFISA